MTKYQEQKQQQQQQQKETKVMRNSIFALLLSVVVLCAVHVRGGNTAPDIVNITTGSILGVRNYTSNVRYWRGVPFGANTNGTNRFLPPKPATSWTGVRNCTVDGPGCMSSGHGTDDAPVQV